MGNINLLVTRATAENMVSLINSSASTVKEISKVPAYALAFLAKELPNNNSTEFYNEVLSSLKYDFKHINIDASLICKRSFTIDNNDLELIRDFILKNDPQLKRPKSSYIIRLAISYTLMCFEEGVSESSTMNSLSINQLDLLENIISLFKEAVETNDKSAIKKIKRIQNIISDNN